MRKVYLVGVMAFGKALAAAYAQEPPRAYFEIRTWAEGYEGTDLPFPFTSFVCEHPLADPPVVVESMRNAEIWAATPLAFEDYEIYAHQDVETEPPNEWEAETDHDVVIDARADFRYQYHIWNEFPRRE